MRSLIYIGISIGILLASNYFSYRYGISRNMTVDPAVDDLYLGRDDYPLIDLCIDEGHKWMIIIKKTNTSPNGGEKYSYHVIADDGILLYSNQANISVTTFPSGHGTTQEGCLYVYMDNKLVKEILFGGDYNLHHKKALERNIRSVSYDQVKRLIHGDLPAYY